MARTHFGLSKKGSNCKFIKVGRKVKKRIQRFKRNKRTQIFLRNKLGVFENRKNLITFKRIC